MKLDGKMLLGFALVLVGVVAFLQSNWKPLQEFRRSPASQVPNTKPLTEAVAPKATAEAAAKPLTKGELLKQYLEAEHPASIERRIETRDPFIARFRLLDRRKVLLKAEEKAELNDILSDREKSSAYQDYLSRVDFTSQTLADEQIYRLFLLQYFESQLSTQKDPALVDYLVEFVLSDNFEGELPLVAKKVLAYEKIKVISLLTQYSPGSLDVIRQKMVGLRHENLLRNTLEHPS